MLVSPLPRWKISFTAAGIGLVPFPSSPTTEVPDQVGEWLIENQFAKKYEEPVKVQPKKREQKQEKPPEPTPEVTPEPVVEDPVLRFLNEATNTQLTEIEGIGNKTVNAIASARPFDSWDKVKTILNDFQIDNLNKLELK